MLVWNRKVKVFDFFLLKYFMVLGDRLGTHIIWPWYLEVDPTVAVAQRVVVWRCVWRV